MNSGSLSQDNRKASEMLGLWEPTRTLTLEAARRHTARIALMRKVLLAAAAALVGILIWQFASQTAGMDIKTSPNESVKMINPRYSGRTSDGLPYKLTADYATRKRQNAAEMLLEKPVMQFYRAAGADVSTVVAQSGIYNDTDKILNLNTAVRLLTDDGYDCKTEHARIFAKDKRIEGDKRIECVGNFGIVNGNSYEILEDYSVFVFKDGMDAILESSGEETP